MSFGIDASSSKRCRKRKVPYDGMRKKNSSSWVDILLEWYHPDSSLIRPKEKKKITVIKIFTSSDITKKPFVDGN